MAKNVRIISCFKLIDFSVSIWVEDKTNIE